MIRMKNTWRRQAHRRGQVLGTQRLVGGQPVEVAPTATADPFV